MFREHVFDAGSRMFTWFGQCWDVPFGFRLNDTRTGGIRIHFYLIRWLIHLPKHTRRLPFGRSQIAILRESVWQWNKRFRSAATIFYRKSLTQCDQWGISMLQLLLSAQFSRAWSTPNINRMCHHVSFILSILSTPSCYTGAAPHSVSDCILAVGGTWNASNTDQPICILHKVSCDGMLRL